MAKYSKTLHFIPVIIIPSKVDFSNRDTFQAISGRQFMQTGITFSLGLLPYLQLPLSAYLSSSPSTWGNHKTLSGEFCTLD